MPGFVTMKPGLKARASGATKAMARAKDERGLRALLSQVRVSPAKKGRRPTEPLGVVDRSNLAIRLRTKLLGEGADSEDRPLEPAPEPSSVCLAAMVDEFLEDEASDRRNRRCTVDDGTATSDEESKSSLRDDLVAVLHSSIDGLPERILLSEITKAVSVGKYVGDRVTSYLVRHVVRHLRRVGHNAAICRSKWDHSLGFPGGDYEYIDVVFEGVFGRYERVVIDVDFRAQFEIARPTPQYDALVQALPPVFVGRQDVLQWIVNVMSDAVKLSLKNRGMYLPPWRKPEYMRAKWFSPYKRTTDDSFDASQVTNTSVKGLDVEEKLVLKEAENGFASRDDGGHDAGSVDNNDWHLPRLKAKKAQGPGYAGLASLFKEANLRKDNMVKVA